MSIPTEIIIPEIDEIVKFFTTELVEQIAKDMDFVQRESALKGIISLNVVDILFRSEFFIREKEICGKSY